MSGVLYIVAGGAPLVARISGLITAARQRGWDPCLILTPTAASWLADEVPGLAELSGHPVRSAYKRPGEPDVLPPAQAMAVVPATFDMINKWAAGISDNLALGLINEALGLPVPSWPCPSPTSRWPGTRPGAPAWPRCAAPGSRSWTRPTRPTSSPGPKCSTRCASGLNRPPRIWGFAPPEHNPPGC